MNMKNTLPLTILLLLLILSCTDAPKVEYGSNNGKYVTVNDTKIYYEEYGQGMPLLLLQGGMGGIKDFEKCIPELSKHYRLIAPDTPGQGRSDLPDSLSYQIIAQFTSKLIDELKLDSTYVMGWSDGGIVGLLLAESRPDKVKKVLAAGANNGVRGVLPPGVDISAAAPPSDEYFEKNNKEWIDNYVKTLPRDWKKFMRDMNKMWYATEYFPNSILENIHIPVMIAQGDQDMIRLEHAVEMHRLIKNSQFCVLPKTSHAVFSDKPELINKIAIDFFR